MNVSNLITSHNSALAPRAFHVYLFQGKARGANPQNVRGNRSSLNNRNNTTLAIWQFNIYVIPKQSLVNKYGHVPEQLNIDKEAWSDHIGNGDLNSDPNFEDALSVHWWLPLNLDLQTIFPLLQQFGNLQEWTSNSEGLRCFGDTETNDICVCFDNKTNKVEELSCRIDLRQIDKTFLDRVLSLASKFDCQLMDTQGRLFPPNLHALSEIVQLSNAKRFVTDPKQFLDDLSKGIVKPE